MDNHVRRMDSSSRSLIRSALFDSFGSALVLLYDYQFLEKPMNVHKFDPGGRAHWEKPRCKICKEFEDHPIHKVK